VVIGLLAGAVFVGVGARPDAPAAAEIPSLVLDVQRDISSLRATVVLHVRQPAGEPAAQHFTGTLTYRAPESLAITLVDDDGARAVLAVDGSTWWTAGPRRCTPPSVARCATITTTRVIVDREPFAFAAATPLDVVAPVASFALSGPPTDLGRRRLEGRDAVGVRVTAAQVAPLLAGFDPTGALRQLHPSDPADVWLDAEHLVPLAVVVRAGGSDDRSRWAAARGYADEPGAVIIDLALNDVRVNGDVSDGAFPPPPTGAGSIDGGFTDGDPDGVDVPLPAYLPAGATAYRAGEVRSAGGPAVDVRTWSDGRAWLAIRATRAWPGPRLFGDVGDVVRPVDLGAAGVGYVSGDGSRVAVHASDVDLVVTGSYAGDELLRVAASVGVRGAPVPAGWAEATATGADDPLIDARVLLPAGLEGFEPAGVRVDGTTVTAAQTGAGERRFVLTATPGDTLAPPIDPDVVAVAVRAVVGRYAPVRGDLEWVEDGFVYSLRSTGLGLGDLLAVADGLEPASR
ncbi:MAG: hypothetical protein ACRD0A_08640, partial [Acidimicrobiales bacterium]